MSILLKSLFYKTKEKDMEYMVFEKWKVEGTTNLIALKPKKKKSVVFTKKI